MPTCTLGNESSHGLKQSVAHGANDVSNAIGPFTTEYETWRTGVASAETPTPTWIKAVGGLGIGFGFWTFGYHIMRSLGSKKKENHKVQKIRLTARF